MKYLYVTLYYSRFKVIPKGVTVCINQIYYCNDYTIGVIIIVVMIIVVMIILIIKTLPQLILQLLYIYILFFVCGSACGCVRQYEHHTTLPHLLPSMYDFMID